jgi:pSer/pThr/pTyr-binding forkhead associated (FHA) protein
VTSLNSGPSLMVVSRVDQARRISVPSRGRVLGRDARLGRPFTTDQFLSRHHVLVRPIGYSLEVIDLGSANGTFVNGTRVRAPTRLRDGDVLRIGQISLKLTAPEEQGEAPPTGERSALPETRHFSPRDQGGYGRAGA